MYISRTEKPETAQVLVLACRQQGSQMDATQRSNLPRQLRRIAKHLALVASAACALFQAACVVGPRYARPSVQAPPTYKELPQKGTQTESEWKVARPDDAAIRGKWWEAFHDPQLNDLEEKASSSNQNIAAAAANFFAARALVRQARSQYFPTVTTNPSIVNSRPSPAQFSGLQTGSSSGFAVKSYLDYSLPFDASWEPDFWDAFGAA